MQSSAAPGGGTRRPQGGDARFAEALRSFALSVRDEPASSLAIVTRTAASVIPGADDAAVVVPDGPGKLRARAVHGDLPPAVLALQNETGQGPCLDALTRSAQVTISDTRAESRWPLFGARAAALGARSMICTPLAGSTPARGSITLVARTAGSLDAESAHLAAVFAVHAAIALAASEAVQQLAAAIATREIIGQAKGILMERHGLTPDAAFALLARASQDTNTKLRDVADQLCRTGDLPRAHRPAPARPAPRRAAPRPRMPPAGPPAPGPG